MTSTIRIKAAQAKAGQVRVFASNGAKHRITDVFTSENSTTLVYDHLGLTMHLHDSPTAIQVELEETHPIAVLERQRDLVQRQWDAAHAELPVSRARARSANIRLDTGWV